MKRARFTEEQIVRVLQDHALSTKVPDMCRRHGITETTFRRWRAKFGGCRSAKTGASKLLEDENR